MKFNKKNILIYVFLSCFLFLPIWVFSDENKTDGLANLFEDIDELNIKSDKWKGDLKKSTASFTGDVKVTADNMEMSCQSLTMHFKKSQKDTSSNSKQPPVDKFHAVGSVKINIPGMGNASAEDAVYQRNTRQVVLTGNPVGKFHMDDRFYEIPGGVEKIIYDLREETILVESSEDTQAELNISGKEKGN